MYIYWYNIYVPSHCSAFFYFLHNNIITWFQKYAFHLYFVISNSNIVLLLGKLQLFKKYSPVFSWPCLSVCVQKCKISKWMFIYSASIWTSYMRLFERWFTLTSFPISPGVYHDQWKSLLLTGYLEHLSQHYFSDDTSQPHKASTKLNMYSRIEFGFHATF